MTLPEFSIRYPTTIAMAALAVVLLGWLSLTRLGTDLFPNLTHPVVTTVLKAPGKSPREIEERYTRRLERAVSSVSGARRVSSVTRSGQCAVVVEFAWGVDMDFAVIDVQKQAAIYGADEDVESVDVTRDDPRALPVMRIAVTSDRGEDIDALVGRIETVVKPDLEGLDGIASVTIEGGYEKEVRVVLDPYLLEAHGLEPSSVAQRIRLENEDVSGGTLKDDRQSYQVKGLGRLKSLEDIRELIVGSRWAEGGAEDGSVRVPIRTSDVARVEMRSEDPVALARLDGIPCVGLAIYREASASTVSVVRTVRERLSSFPDDLPGTRFIIVENQARFIEDAISEVESAALYGGLLALAVILAFLRGWRVTATIGVAIPISILATFTLMYFEDMTLNVMSLGGLALGAGMLVDNAIVVIENIYRHLEQGEDAGAAAASGTAQVGTAILASTLTTVSVFLPIVYLQGLAGELFKEQAWTVTFSLLSSLAVAMTVVPMLASRMLRSPARPVASARNWIGPRVASALDHKGRTLGLTLLLALGAVALGTTLQTEFIPREDQGLFQVELTLPEGTRLEVTDGIANRVSAIVREIGGEAVGSVYAYVGEDAARSFGDASSATGPNRATLSVSLATGRTRDASSILARLSPALAEIPELEVGYALHETSLESLIGGGGAPIEVAFTGDDLDRLRALTEALRSALDGQPALTNVRTSFQDGQPELDLALRMDVAASLGMTPESIVGLLTRRLSGEDAGELEEGDRVRTIRVGYEEVDASELGAVRVDAPDGAILTLADLADPSVIEGPREILRDAQRRVGRVSANIAEGVPLGQAIEQVESALARLDLPAGYRVTLGGEERERAESFEGLKFALVLSVILIYMVMASLFESLLHPFTVMLTLPLAGLGVVYVFAALHIPLSVMAFIGIIMLGGIAVNDAIILVDRINQLRPATANVREAILAAVVDRLRPILMTSATTILALLPMAVGVGDGAAMRAPMALAVIGGMVSSTLMTLFVIPVVYESVEALRSRIRR